MFWSKMPEMVNMEVCAGFTKIDLNQLYLCVDAL